MERQCRGLLGLAADGWGRSADVSRIVELHASDGPPVSMDLILTCMLALILQEEGGQGIASSTARLPFTSPGYRETPRLGLHGRVVFQRYSWPLHLWITNLKPPPYCMRPCVTDCSGLEAYRSCVVLPIRLGGSQGSVDALLQLLQIRDLHTAFGIMHRACTLKAGDSDQLGLSPHTSDDTP